MHRPTHALITLALLLLLLVVNASYAQIPLTQSHDITAYDKGAELLHHRNYGAAREAFASYLATASPDDARQPDAAYGYAFASVSLGHSDGEKLMDNFIRDYPQDPRSATAYADLGNSLYLDKDYAKAVSYFSKADLSVLPHEQQVEAHFRWGYSLFNLRRFDEALEQFNSIKNESSQYTPAANYYSGFIYYSKAQYDRALTDYKKAEAFPAYANVVPRLVALCYYKQNQNDALIEYFASLKGREESINDYKEIVALCADANYAKGTFDRAAALYDQYYGGSYSGDAAMLYRAGFSDYSIGKDEPAAAYLKAAATNDSIASYASYYLGLIYLKNGNKPYALNSFEVARKCSDCDGLAEESMFQSGKLDYDLGHPDDAIALLEEFKTKYPNSEHLQEVNELLAHAYVNGNNYNRAIEYIEAMKRRSPSVDAAYQKATYLKGAERFNMNDYAGAVDYFKKSLEYPIDKKYVALASLWCGEAYSIGGKYDDAVPEYLTVLGLGNDAEPDVIVKTRYGLGYAYFNEKQYDHALVNFKEFVSKCDHDQPNYVDGLIRLADCYYVSKQYEDALVSYNKARQYNSPDNDFIFLQLGMIDGILKKYDDSRKQFAVLINSYPKSPYRDEAMFQNAQFEIEQGNYQAAVDGLTKLITEMHNSKFLPYAFMRRAASNFNLKQYEKTVNDYVFVLQNFPNHPVAQQALLPLQEVLNTLGRSAEFQKYLDAFKQSNPGSKDLEVVDFEAAKNNYFNQSYDRAVTAFNDFINNYPSSSRISEARYYLAESYYWLKQFDKALPLYKLVADDPNFTQSGKAVSRLAEIQFQQGNLQDAVSNYHRLEKIADNKKDQYNAWSGLMESFYLLAKYDSCDFYAKTILDRGIVNSSAQNKATLFLGKSAMARGDYESAKDQFLSTLNTARDQYSAEAKYHLGEIFYFSKDYKQCYQTLVSLNSDFAAYDEWVGKSYLLLADNFVAMGDTYQAKATLQSLIDNFPLETVREQARQKLKTIAQVASKPATDSTKVMTDSIPGKKK